MSKLLSYFGGLISKMSGRKVLLGLLGTALSLTGGVLGWIQHSQSIPLAIGVLVATSLLVAVEDALTKKNAVTTVNDVIKTLAQISGVQVIEPPKEEKPSEDTNT